MTKDKWSIDALEEAFDAAAGDVRDLTAGLTEQAGAWRASADSWSVTECLDHLARSNRAYLRAMQPPAEHAFRAGRRGRRPARPGWLGRWAIWTLEPPVKSLLKTKTPAVTKPRVAPPLSDALKEFLASQDEIYTFLREYADIDLGGARFHNPFVRGIRFSLLTGLHIIAAHERRHLWQAWRVRRAAELFGGQVVSGRSTGKSVNSSGRPMHKNSTLLV